MTENIRAWQHRPEGSRALADAVTWPMLNGAATQKNYSSPQGTVYITEGNGAVPGTGPNTTLGKPPADW